MHPQTAVINTARVQDEEKLREKLRPDLLSSGHHPRLLLLLLRSVRRLFGEDLVTSTPRGFKRKASLVGLGTGS